MVQQFAPQHLADHAVGRGVEREDGEMAKAEPFLEPGLAEARDRRHEDEYLRQHDEEDRQDKQTG